MVIMKAMATKLQKQVDHLLSRWSTCWAKESIVKSKQVTWHEWCPLQIWVLHQPNWDEASSKHSDPNQKAKSMPQQHACLIAKLQLNSTRNKTIDPKPQPAELLCTYLTGPFPLPHLPKKRIWRSPAMLTQLAIYGAEVPRQILISKTSPQDLLENLIM
jgi:hypothetical protein